MTGKIKQLIISNPRYKTVSLKNIPDIKVYIVDKIATIVNIESKIIVFELKL